MPAPHHRPAFLKRSNSAARAFVILSATSALAPRNLAPLLSCVVDQITSPSLFTSRTVARASCFRSLMLVDSRSPALTLTDAEDVFVERIPVPAAPRTSTPSDDE